jgi:hypothetical protein
LEWHLRPILEYTSVGVSAFRKSCDANRLLSLLFKFTNCRHKNESLVEVDCRYITEGKTPAVEEGKAWFS